MNRSGILISSVLSALTLLALNACTRSPQQGAAPHPPDVALTVDAGTLVSVTRAEIDRAAELLQFATFEGTEAHYERLALREVVLPRAAIRSANAEAYREALELAEQLQTQLVDGQAHPDEVLRRGDMDLFGPLVVGTAIELGEGTWSDPIEALGSIQFVRVVEPHRPGLRSIELAVITFPYATDLSSYSDIERYLDESVLEIIDPGYEEIIPTRITHLMAPKTN